MRDRVQAAIPGELAKLVAKYWARSEDLATALSQRDELIRDVKDGMGVEFDDPLLDYVTVQLDRDVFRALSEDPAAPSETED